MIRLQNPQDQQRGPNCGVTALAIVAGISFAEAWRLAKNASGRPRFSGGMTDRDIGIALSLANVDCQKVPDVKGMTVQNFAHMMNGNNKTYFVVSTGHAQVVQNGRVADQSGVFNIADFWGRRKKLRYAAEIIEPPEDLSVAAQTFGLPLFDQVGV